MPKPLRLLIVEDLEDDAELLLRVLQSSGYIPESRRVDTAAAMQAALDTAEWDIVFADYSMPSFTGMQALELLRNTGRDIPFILISGTIGEDLAVMAMKAGAHDYFVKGNLGRLAAAVERELQEAALRHKQRADSLALRESEERFNAFINNIPTPAWIKDEKFSYVYVNAPLAQLLGREVNELIGRTDFDVMTREIASTLRGNDEQVLKSNQVLNTLETIIKADGHPGIFTVIKFPLGHAAGRRHVAGVALDITERIRSAEQLQGANRRLQLLSRKVIEIQERERQHISRGLHDDIGQALTAVKLNLDLLRKRFTADSDAKEIDDSVHITEQALQQVRELSFDLRPPQLDDLGFAAALRWYLERKAGSTGISVQLHCDLPGDRLHPEIETACFRIVLEAMTNVLRHAAAHNVWVEVRSKGELLHLSIRDDGHGFDVDAARQRSAHGESLGLVSMEERASLVGGRIEIASRQGQGTVVELFLPMQSRIDALLGGSSSGG